MSYFQGEVCCGLDPVVLCQYQDPYSGQLLCDPLQPTQALQLPPGQFPPTARLLQLVSAQQAAVTTAGSGSNSSISSSSSNNSSSGVFSALPYSTVSQSMSSTGSMLQLVSAHQPALGTASSGSSSSSSSTALNALPYGTVNLLGITDAAPYNLLPLQSQQSLQSLPQLLEPLQLLQQPAQPPSFQQQTHQLHLSQPQQQQQLAEQQHKLAHVLPQQLLESLQLQQPPLYPFLAEQQQQQTLAHVLPLVHPLQQPQQQQQQQQLQQQQQHPAAIFFARAHADVSTEQLLGVFAQFGRVMDIDLFRPFRGCKTSKGCGMVVYSSRLEAAAAVETLHERFVWPGARGPMVVEWCDPNKQYNRKQPPSLAPEVLQQVQRLQQRAVTHTSGVQSNQRILPTGSTGGSFSLGMLPNAVGAPRGQLAMPRYQ